MNKLSRRITRTLALLLAAASFSGCCLHGAHFCRDWAPRHCAPRHCR